MITGTRKSFSASLPKAPKGACRGPLVMKLKNSSWRVSRRKMVKNRNQECHPCGEHMPSVEPKLDFLGKSHDSTTRLSSPKSESRPTGRKRIDFGRAVSRILSAPEKPGERIICLSSRYPKPVPPRRNAERAAPGSPIWPCTRWGFPCPAGCPAGGKLLPHLFTLAPPLRAGRFAFLWHFPSKCLEAFLPCLSARRGAAGVTRHRALWCSDFPPPSRLHGTKAILRPSKITLNIPGKCRMTSARKLIENWKLKIFNLQFSIPAPAKYGDKV